MKLTKMKNIGGAILGLLLLLGIGAMSSTTAQAQYPNYDPYRNRDYNRDQQDRYRRNRDRDYDRYNRRRNQDNYSDFGGSFQFRQTALNAGYNEGVKAGRDDRRRGRYNPEGHGSFQSASKDYNSRMGDRWMYQRYFREAFINGYADGQRGY